MRNRNNYNNNEYSPAVQMEVRKLAKSLGENIYNPDDPIDAVITEKRKKAFIKNEENEAREFFTKNYAGSQILRSINFYNPDSEEDLEAVSEAFSRLGINAERLYGSLGMAKMFFENIKYYDQEKISKRQPDYKAKEIMLNPLKEYVEEYVNDENIEKLQNHNFEEYIHIDNIDEELKILQYQTIIQSVCMLDMIYLSAMNVLEGTSKPNYIIEWDRKNRDKMLGDSRDEKYGAIRDLLKRFGYIQNNKSKKHDQSSEMMDLAQKAVDYNLRLNAVFYESEEKLVAVREKLYAEQAKLKKQEAERARFGSVIEKIANVDGGDLNELYESTTADIKILREKEKTTVRKYNSDLVASQDSKKSAPKNKSEKQTERKNSQNKTEKNPQGVLSESDMIELIENLPESETKGVDREKLKMLVLLNHSMGGTLYQSKLNGKNDGDKAYFATVFEYQGKPCAVAECPKYGNATYVWVGDVENNGAEWSEVLTTRKNAKSMGAVALRHTVMFNGEAGDQGQDEFDHSRHIWRVYDRIDKLATK